ncbi:MAG: Hsp20/alpha crystallin family protein [Gemmatimonadetes bacterium]|nr:Hsp20/alpha crystallin family protein [Gemmatimonadota bacterium]
MLPVLRRNRTIPAEWDFFSVGREFDRLLGNVGSAFPTGWSPSVDVRESDDEFLVSAELPGLKAGDVEVTIEDGVLSLTGEKKEVIEEGGGKNGSGRHVVERRYGRFVRKFSLPREVNAGKVTAKFADGVLEVALPKTATAKPRQIKISAN